MTITFIERLIGLALGFGMGYTVAAMIGARRRRREQEEDNARIVHASAVEAVKKATRNRGGWREEQW